MKITLLQDDFPPATFGGAGFSTYELAQGLKAAGEEVTVITACKNAGEAGESEYEGLKIFKVASDYPGKWRWYRSLYNPPAVREMTRILSATRPDIVHAHNIHYHLSYHSLLIAKHYAKAVVWTARDVMSFNFAKLETERYIQNRDAHTTWRDHIHQAKKRYNPLRNMLIRWYLRSLDARFAVSDALRTALLQNNINDVRVVHTGLDTRAWEVGKEALVHFRDKFNLNGKKVILFSGRLSVQKGGEKALHALRSIVEEVPEAVLLVAGKIDEYAEIMKEEATKLGVADHLIFTDWISGEERRAAFYASDVVWLVSTAFDSMPRVVLEAMACGKPVIGTRYGGAPEAIVEGVTGFVVNPREARQIAEKSLILLKDPAKAAAFGVAGRERIKNEFSLKKMVDTYLGHYRAVVEKPKGSR